MKKILIATTALAFAGSAFAADTSGYAVSAYKTNDKDGTKSSALYSEAEAYVSGSKTTANGLTFGATLTVGLSGDNTAYKASELVGLGTTDVKTDGSYTYINSFVSGAFGKIATGRLSSAGRSIGAPSIAVGGGTVNTANHTIARNRTNRGTVVFTTPTIAGVTAAYSSDFGHKYNADDKTAKSFALNYAGEFSGVSVGAAFNMDSVTESKAKTNSVASSNEKRDEKAMGVKIGYMGANFSYTTADKQDKLSGGVAVTDAAKYKEARIGLDYTISGATLGYAQNTFTNDKDSDETKKNLISVQYQVAEGLSVFVENYTVKTTKTVSKVTTESTDKSMYVGTNISF